MSTRKRTFFAHESEPEVSAPVDSIHIETAACEPLSPPWAFASILAPVLPSTFSSAYWGKRPLHVARNDPGFYRQLMTLDELERYLAVDEVFTRHAISTPSEREGPPEPPPSSIGELHERLLQGSSLRIRRLECLIDPASPLRTLVRDMELTLQHPKDSLSCYVAPPDAVGLGAHCDETEIFTLQISGAKRWRIYHRVNSDGAARFRPDDLGAPTYDAVLEAGDMLYLPRGWVHHVTSERPAFSITIVFDPIKWTAILDVLISQLEGTSSFMAPLPAGVLLESGAGSALASEFRSRIDLAIDALSRMRVEDVIDRAASTVVSRLTPPPDRRLERLFTVDEITIDSVVERVSSFPCRVSRYGERAVLIVAGGYALHATAEAEPALRAVAAADGPFRVADMHNSLSSAAKVVLARKLVASGLLRLV